MFANPKLANTTQSRTLRRLTLRGVKQICLIFVNLNFQRTLPARLASRPCLVYDLSWGEKPLLFYPLPSYSSSRHQYRPTLIDWFWSSFWVFFYADTFLCCETDILYQCYPYSWSRNFLFKVNTWRFFYPRVGGCMRTGAHTDAVSFGGFWNRFPTFLIYLNFVAPLLVVFYFLEGGDYRVFD